MAKSNLIVDSVNISDLESSTQDKIKTRSIKSKPTRWRRFLLFFKFKAAKVDQEFTSKRSLGTPFARTIHIWADLVGIAIVGQYNTWNLGLTYNWPNFTISTILATAVFWCLSLCLAELSVALPFTGGPNIFAHAAFGTLAASLVGYSYLLSNVFGIAQTLISGGQLLLMIFNVNDQYTALGYWTVLVLLLLPLQYSKQCFFNSGVIISALSCLFIVIIAICLLPFSSHFTEFLLAESPLNSTGILVSNMTSNDTLGMDAIPSFASQVTLDGILASLPFSFWWYIGIEMVSLTTEEVKDSDRSIPRGSIYSMTALTIATWIVLIVVSGVYPGTVVIANSSQPLIDALFYNYNIDYTSPGGIILQLIGLLGYIAAFHCNFYALGRQIYGLSRGGHLPASWSLTTPLFDDSKRAVLKKLGAKITCHGEPNRGTLVGIISVSLVSLILTVSGLYSSVSNLLIYATVLITVICYFCEFAAYIILKKRMSTLPRPYRNPLGVPSAAFGAFMCVVLMVSCLSLESEFQWGALVCLVALILMIPYYIFVGRIRLLETPEKEFIKRQLKYKLNEKMSQSNGKQNVVATSKLNSNS